MRLRTLLIAIASLLLLLASVWWATRETSYAITNVKPTGSAIIAFGDSLTSGVGAAADQSYPAQLSRRLGVPVINAGVGGDTTADALRRLDGDVLARDPRIVIVCLGGNDLLRRTPREATMDNIEEIVERIQARGALVVLVGLRPIMGSSFAGDIAELAREKGCPLVPDILGGIMHDADLMSDAIHPNAAGYARFVERIAPVVEPYLTRP